MRYRNPAKSSAATLKTISFYLLATGMLLTTGCTNLRQWLLHIQGRDLRAIHIEDRQKITYAPYNTNNDSSLLTIYPYHVMGSDAEVFYGWIIIYDDNGKMFSDSISMRQFGHPLEVQVKLPLGHYSIQLVSFDSHCYGQVLMKAGYETRIDAGMGTTFIP